jgi:hypothetical protein
VTGPEMYAAIREIVDTYRNRPQEFLTNRAVIVLKRKGRAPGGERVRVLPGVIGRFLCQNSDGGIVVDCPVDALERWLAKNADWREPPSDAGPGEPRGKEGDHG